MLRLDLIFQYQQKAEPNRAALTPTSTATDRDRHLLGQKDSLTVTFNPVIGGSGTFNTSS